MEGDTNTNTQTTEPNTEPQGEPEGDNGNSEEMAKLKALVKERDQEINRLKNEKLTEDERRKAELEQREADIARREAESKARDNKYHATQALAGSGILVDGIAVKDVLPFVMGADETLTCDGKRQFQRFPQEDLGIHRINPSRGAMCKHLSSFPALSFFTARQITPSKIFCQRDIDLRARTRYNSSPPVFSVLDIASFDTGKDF